MIQLKIHILIILVLSVFISIQGQETKIIQTTELYSIAKENGLDSVLVLINELPVYLIDKESSYKLFDFLGDIENSYKLEQFISSYSYCYRNKETRNVLIEYLSLLKGEVPNYLPTRFGTLPFLQDEFYNTLIKNSSPRIEKSLIEYYQLWYRKSLKYKEDYLKSKIKAGQDSILLSKPYESCNENCYSILLTLRKMNSSFCSKELFKYHEQDLLFQIGYSLDLYNLTPKLRNRKPEKIIELSKSYDSIGEINTNIELQYEEFISKKSSCRKTLLFNGKVGFIDIVCSYRFGASFWGGEGKSYRLVLKKNKLYIYDSGSWVS